MGKLVKYSDFSKMRGENQLLEQEIQLLEEQIRDLNIENVKMNSHNAMMMSMPLREPAAHSQEIESRIT